MNQFNDEVQLDHTFKRFEQMNRTSINKDKTYSKLMSSLDRTEKVAKIKKIFLRTVTIFAIATILFGGYWFLQGGYIPSMETRQAHPSILSDPTQFTIEKNDDGTWTFLSEDKVVGGLDLITLEEMQEATRPRKDNPALFEKEEMSNFPFSTTRTLVHIKTMDIFQTIHYYFNPEEGNQSMVYDLYFHTPYFDKEEAFRIAQSFTLTN